MISNIVLSFIVLFLFQSGFGQNDNSNIGALSCCDSIPARYNEKGSEEYKGMVWIPGGTFLMGGKVAEFMKDWPYYARSRNDERPVHKVKLSGFWMSETPVTNRQFKEFVNATNYITTAEKTPTLEEIMPLLPPGSKPPSEEALIPASLLFKAPNNPVPLSNPLAWWQWKPNANWMQPEGPGSSIDDRMDHPVVHISYFDAKAYAKWKGLSLPTEAQWEYAARGGNEQKIFTWGNSQVSGTNPRINIWQGRFPYKNTALDGYKTTSPVKKFEPNDYGLYDMSGNVWEWVLDWYHFDAYQKRSKNNDIVLNPKGPNKSYDPQEPHLPKRVIRGGSFLCNDSYCSGYRPAARMKNSPDTSSNHIGFRVVKNK